MTNEELENEINEKGLNAPRLNLEYIDSCIIDECYWQPINTTLTICVLKLKNGTCVVGESACVSLENFDAELGKKIARENAKNKIWALEGYLLKNKLFEQGQ